MGFTALHFELKIRENSDFQLSSLSSRAFFFFSVIVVEVATRLSPLCCENMAQSRAIATIFVLIRSCNRSVPCMDVIRYSVQVLLNVSKVTLIFYFGLEAVDYCGICLSAKFESKTKRF